MGKETFRVVPGDGLDENGLSPSHTHKNNPDIGEHSHLSYIAHIHQVHSNLPPRGISGNESIVFHPALGNKAATVKLNGKEIVVPVAKSAVADHMQVSDHALTHPDDELGTTSSIDVEFTTKDISFEALKDVEERTNLCEVDPNSLWWWANQNQDSPLHWAVMEFINHLVLTRTVNVGRDTGIFTKPTGEDERIAKIQWATIVNGQLHIKFEGEPVQIRSNRL